MKTYQKPLHQAFDRMAKHKQPFGVIGGACIRFCKLVYPVSSLAF